MKFYLINEDGARFIDIPNTLDDINKALGWDDAWNTPTIVIKQHRYIAICSDLGKVKHEPISCVCLANFFMQQEAMQEPFLVGPIIITKFDGIDDFTDLNEEDMTILQGRTYKVQQRPFNDMYKNILIMD